MTRLALFLFRYLDALGKWPRSRYRAELHEIQERFADWETIGPPEIRDVDPNERYFNAHRLQGLDNLGPVFAVRTGSRNVAIVGVAG